MMQKMLPARICELVAWIDDCLGWILGVIEKPKDQRGFQALPKALIVERTFAWLVRQCRLTRDYERLPETSEAFTYTALILLMARRLAKTSKIVPLRAWVVQAGSSRYS